MAYNASSDVIHAEQAADTHLKDMVHEWESEMEAFKVKVEKRVADELNPTMYPQVGDANLEILTLMLCFCVSCTIMDRGDRLPGVTRSNLCFFLLS